MLYKQVIR